MKPIEQQIKEIVCRFEVECYFPRKILGEEVKGKEAFYEFINKEYKVFNNELHQSAETKKMPVDELVYRCLKEEGNALAPLFNSYGYFEEYHNNIMEDKILRTKEVQDIRKVQPYLNEEQSERIVGRLAKILYDKLDEETKKKTSSERVKTYILNLGFIKLPRLSHKGVCDIIIRYKPLFKNEQEVIDSIVSRYADEELAITPITDTSSRIKEIKKEIIEMYEGITK